MFTCNLLLLVLFHRTYIARGLLLFPSASVYQITSSVSAPIEIPMRKLFLDWGFQMNYDLPVSPDQFSNAAIWPNIFEDRRNTRELHWNATQAKYALSHEGSANGGWRLQHPSDFTAGELYQSFENLLDRYGFHETCLLRSVCELAKHPFADAQRNILTEMLTFLLTPSLHEGFGPHEEAYRLAYEEAEQRGFFEDDCNRLYADCSLDLLSALSRVVLRSQ